jgi:hypothetical protein
MVATPYLDDDYDTLRTVLVAAIAMVVMVVIIAVWMPIPTIRIKTRTLGFENVNPQLERRVVFVFIG